MVEKPLHMLVVVNAFLSARDTHFAKSSLLAPVPLLTYVQTFYILWKQFWKVWNMKHQMFVMHVKCAMARWLNLDPHPLLCAHIWVTCELWPLQMNKWWLIGLILLLEFWTKTMKWVIHLSNNVVVIQTLGYIAIVALDSHLVMKFCLKHLLLKMYKFGSDAPIVLRHDNINNHLSALGVIECIVHEPVRVKTRAFPFWLHSLNI